jgi:beta-galactosidase
VEFASGTVKAIGRNQGKVAATYELRTAGPAAQIQLTVDKNSIVNDWNDVAFVNATVLDAQGVVVPNAENLINFKVQGAGFVAAVDSANSNSHEPYQASQRQAFQGICLALIKANANRGKIKVTATSTNLRSASLELTVARASRP